MQISDVVPGKPEEAVASPEMIPSHILLRPDEKLPKDRKCDNCYQTKHIKGYVECTNCEATFCYSCLNSIEEGKEIREEMLENHRCRGFSPELRATPVKIGVERVNFLVSVDKPLPEGKICVECLVNSEEDDVVGFGVCCTCSSVYCMKAVAAFGASLPATKSRAHLDPQLSFRTQSRSWNPAPTSQFFVLFDDVNGYLLWASYRTNMCDNSSCYESQIEDQVPVCFQPGPPHSSSPPPNRQITSDHISPVREWMIASSASHNDAHSSVSDPESTSSFDSEFPPVYRRYDSAKDTEFHSFNLQILRSGEFSDLHVRVGTVVFRLHSVVVFPQCDALMANYQAQAVTYKKVLS
ncbi:hypothetical protein BJ508DRAFT_313146 [Ascobolus immersus RN42]|uniref:Uncharacterized protein n=1 Tax=Ascobolus immersus RN42 TaxID=1160509 RepID=A0A3N4HPZ7_ASCIM|nr:hypothetical protein BJ508DRAFT_313146 [Ascobolus immersus RN42]